MASSTPRAATLEDDWITNPEVLVGITLTRSPTQNGITQSPVARRIEEHFSSDRPSQQGVQFSVCVGLD
ncbi:hypothetical protein SCLCIDRAFT_721432 [Scleroderma citrinum Foug A]|uniref:Uncharacterized protein n=1 Tax=Scleroderma citrinum Foug A TaxID=1036808 RepID=A0A0C3ENF3_9AGAM|nr:hypothetical protein SCLCIDRAFT_721432 [Scleroderma citrinum Foug A]